jgi:hypothetical protein
VRRRVASPDRDWQLSGWFRATWAKGSDCSDHCARQSEAPPDIELSSTTWTSGSSAMKREGMELVHCP